MPERRSFLAGLPDAASGPKDLDDVAHCVASIMGVTESVFVSMRRLAQYDVPAARALGRLAAAIELATLDWCSQNAVDISADAAASYRGMH